MPCNILSPMKGRALMYLRSEAGTKLKYDIKIIDITKMLLKIRVISELNSYLKILK